MKCDGLDNTSYLKRQKSSLLLYMKRCFSGLLKVFLIIKTTPTRSYCSRFTILNRGICFNYYLLLYRGVDKHVSTVHRNAVDGDGHKRDGHKRDGHKRDGHKRDGHDEDRYKGDRIKGRLTLIKTYSYVRC
jgi:hypothetical protein